MDFDIMAARGRLLRFMEKRNRNSRTEFAVDEFEDNFDELFERVEKGETLTIVHTDGKKVFMMPLSEYEKCLTGFTPKNDSN